MTGGKPKLRKSYRSALGAAEDEAAKFGAAIEYQLAGKHPSFTISLNGMTRRSLFASTPRTSSQPLYMRQRVRQMIAAMTRDPDRSEVEP